MSGRRLGLVIPQEHGDHAAALIRSELGDLGGRLRVRFGQAMWEPGDTGDEVIRRARGSLGPAVPAQA
ncbi:MAG: hypothetical protein DLM61_10685 [Pseudonocardiales bacterium]|nr:MAG: hypothetical protein DLM61_10685 [Pseudonocardiales bacterium]